MDAVCAQWLSCLAVIQKGEDCQQWRSIGINLKNMLQVRDTMCVGNVSVIPLFSECHLLLQDDLKNSQPLDTRHSHPFEIIKNSISLVSLVNGWWKIPPHNGADLKCTVEDYTQKQVQMHTVARNTMQTLSSRVPSSLAIPSVTNSCRHLPQRAHKILKSCGHSVRQDSRWKQTAGKRLMNTWEKDVPAIQNTFEYCSNGHGKILNRC